MVPLAPVRDPACGDRFSRAMSRAVGEAVDADLRNVFILKCRRPIEVAVLARAAKTLSKYRHLGVLHQQIQLVATPSQRIDGLIEPRRFDDVPSRRQPVAVQSDAAALNPAQYDRVRRQRPADLLADGRVSMLGALNVEYGDAVRLDHVPDRQQYAQKKHRRAL